MDRYDVVVVGAGLAGLKCALLLSRDGLKVALIDRKASLETSIHTTGIFVRRTLEDFDIPAAYLGPPIREVALYSPSRRALALASEHDEFRIGRMAGLYAEYLDQCLRAGVTWMPETRYAESHQVRNEALVRLENHNRSRWIAARYLIGADGAKSRVARDLGLDLNRQWIVGVEDVLTNVPPADSPRLHCFLDPHLAPGYLAWVAHDGEETHIGVGGYAARFEPVPALERFKASLEGIVDLRSAKVVERRGGRIPVGGVLRHIANKRGLLIGDAAGAVSPLTAGGLDPCLRLSTLAASVTARYLQTGDETALSEYSGRRFRSRFVSRLWMRRIIANVHQPALVEIACAFLRWPVFNSLARHVFFGRGSFPDVGARSLRPPISEPRGALL